MTMRFWLVACLAAGFVAPAIAADPPPGATSCSGCHGAGPGAFMPITGRDADALAATLMAFRAGEIPSTLMGRLMKGFTPDDIRAIATWVAAQN